MSKADLLEHIKNAKPGPFKPRIAYFPEGDFIDYYFSDEPCYALPINPTLVLYKGQETNELVGIQLHGIGKQLPEWAAELSKWKQVMEEWRKAKNDTVSDLN